MIENPVRSASEETAKEIESLFRNHKHICMSECTTKLIESKFAPVVAATEEAMKEKIRRAVKKELGFIIQPEEVSSYCSPTSIAWADSVWNNFDSQ